MKRKKRNAKKRKALLLVSLLLIAAFAVGGTLAYITTKTDDVKNVFTTASVPPKIVEDFEDYAKKSVVVKNNGDISGYMRVVMVANELNEKGEIIGAAYTAGLEGKLKLTENPSGEQLSGGCWFKSGGFYYWSLPVAAGASTGDLIASSEDPIVVYHENEEGEIVTNIQVTFLTESIQAEGTTEAGVPAVTDAWGIAVGDNGCLNPTVQD